MSSLFKQFFSVASPTAASRITGFFRDMVIASIFGSTGMTDLFFVALKAPNLIRRLFGEGTLSQAAIPILVKSEKREFAETVRSANSIAMAFFLIVAAFGVAFPKAILSAIAPGIVYSSRVLTAVKMLQISFPYLFFIGLSVWLSTVLNSKKHFFVPAASPIMLNISIIIAAGSAYLFHLSIVVLCWGIIAGGIGQLIVNTTAAAYYKIPLSFGMKINGNLILIGKRMLPALIATGAMQLSTWADTIIASFLNQGAISTLFYANRIIQLPLAILAISLSTILVPNLSSKSDSDIKKFMQKTLPVSIILFFLISLFIAVAGKLITGIIFERGAFNLSNTKQVYYALIAYSPSLFSYSLIRVITPLFYAKGDTKTPSRLSIIGVVTTIFFAIILSIEFGYIGIAIATSIGSTVNAYLLIKKIDQYGITVRLPVIKSITFIAVIIFLIEILHPAYPNQLLSKIALLIIFLVIFLGLSRIFYGGFLKKLL